MRAPGQDRPMRSISRLIARSSSVARGSPSRILRESLLALKKDKVLREDLSRLKKACCAPQRLVTLDGAPLPAKVGRGKPEATSEISKRSSPRPAARFG